MHQRFLRVLQIAAIAQTALFVSALFAGLGTTQPAEARPDCPGFQANRNYRERSDHEAPLLPRTSIAAIAIQSPDGCDRSSEKMPEPQANQSPESARQSEQSPPADEAKPVLEPPIER